MAWSRSDIALAVGIVSVVVPVLGPPAWVYGARAVSVIDSGREPGDRERARMGRRLAQIGTALLVMGLALGLFFSSPVPQPS
ncbi:MAG: hypothetical protein QM572_17495 [Nocardioides sp.]|uniref:hypothetical protein n=1 Tax=Nocardioides sp. TaxID=35761 RepID=UPI0039E2FC99